MVTSQISLPEWLVQWFETNLTATEGQRARQDLSALELVRTLESYAVLVHSRHVSDVQQLQTSVAAWTVAMRKQVTELLRRVNEEPLLHINTLLGRFIATCERQPTEEELRKEGATVGKLIEAEQARIQSIRDGSHDGTGKKRQQLSELLDAADRWKSELTQRGQALKERAAEVHAWQIIASIATDLDCENKDVLAPELSTQSLRRFTRQLTDLRKIIGDVEPAATITDSLDCRTVPEAVTKIVERRTKSIAEHSETFRRLRVVALRVDQRRTLQYVSRVVQPLLICAALGWLLYERVDHLGDSRWAALSVIAVFVAVVLVLIWLAVLGKSAGVKPDDKVQLLIVRSLRVCAHPFGSVLLLALIGLLIVDLAAGVS